MSLMYANLLGNWTLLNDEPTLIIDNSYKDASLWIEEKLSTLNDYPYINITFKNKNYRVHPSQIQIVTE